jgi:hypothetical protein
MPRMAELPFTADGACRVLRRAIDHYCRGEGSSGDLRAWLTSEFHLLHGTASDHPARRLYTIVLIDLAVFLQCDFERDQLTASLQTSVEQVEAGRVGIPDLLVTPCGHTLIKQTGSLDALMQLTGNNRRRRLRADGFQDI